MTPRESVPIQQSPCCRRASAAQKSALNQHAAWTSRRGRTNASRSCSAPDVSDIERLQPRGGDGAFERGYSGRYRRHHPCAISVPLPRPPLFRLPISHQFEGRIQRWGYLLEFFNATMELAHSAGPESFAPQPSQLGISARWVAINFKTKSWRWSTRHSLGLGLRERARATWHPRCRRPAVLVAGATARSS
jgi:hypothetical protein